MRKKPIPAPEPAPIPDPAADPTIVNSLFTAMYPALYQAVYDAQPGLLFGDADSILALLTEELPSYRGSLNMEAFAEWALDFVRRQAERFADTTIILSRNRQFIRAAIRRTMPYGLFDNALSTEDLQQEAAIQVFKIAESLAGKDGKEHAAKESSRVYGATKTHLKFYFTQKMRDRWELLLGRIAQGEPLYLCECLTNQEVRAELYSEKESQLPFAA